MYTIQPMIHQPLCVKYLSPTSCCNSIQLFHNSPFLYPSPLTSSVCSQTGFGWTNGVVLHFLQLYGNVLRASSRAPVEEARPLWVIGLVLATVLLAVCFLLCGVWCRCVYITGRTGYWRRVKNEHAVANRGYHENDDFDYIEDNSVTLENIKALSGSTQGILSTVHEIEPSP